jgi:hypothetical protein
MLLDVALLGDESLSSVLLVPWEQEKIAQGLNPKGLGSSPGLYGPGRDDRKHRSGYIR